MTFPIISFLFSQEIEPRCAESLCRLFPSDPTIDLLSISKKTDKHQSSRSPLSKDVNHSPDRPRSDVTLSPTNLAIIFLNLYRTFKKGVG